MPVLLLEPVIWYLLNFSALRADVAHYSIINVLQLVLAASQQTYVTVPYNGSVDEGLHHQSWNVAAVCYCLEFSFTFICHCSLFCVDLTSLTSSTHSHLDGWNLGLHNSLKMRSGRTLQHSSIWGWSREASLTHTNNKKEQEVRKRENEWCKT